MASSPEKVINISFWIKPFPNTTPQQWQRCQAALIMIGKYLCQTKSGFMALPNVSLQQLTTGMPHCFIILQSHTDAIEQEIKNIIDNFKVRSNLFYMFGLPYTSDTDYTAQINNAQSFVFTFNNVNI